MVAFVQHAQNSGNSISSLSVTLSATTAGNCLVVCFSTGDLSSVSSVQVGSSTDNFAQLATVTDSGSSVSAFIWADPNCAGGQTSVTVTLSTSDWLLIDVYEFSGVKTSSPLDKSSTGSGTGSTSWSSGTTGTTTQASEAWVGTAIALQSGNNALTGPSPPWTNSAEMDQARGKFNYMSQMSGYQVASSTGTATYSGTDANSAFDWAAAVVTLLPNATPKSVSDSGSSSESFTVSATVPVSDSGSGTEALSVSATVPGIADSGSSSESLSVVKYSNFPQYVLGLKVELLLNGTWTDVTSYVYQRSVISITGRGRQNDTTSAQPSSMTMTLNNRGGRFTPKNSNGAYYPYITRNTQIRVSVTAASSSGSTYNGYRFYGEVSAWPVQWDPTGNDVYEQVTASGILRRLTQNTAKLGSALSRYVNSLTGAEAPLAYWTCEDMSGASQFASALASGDAMTWTGNPSLASDTAFGGSDPLPQLNGSAWTGTAGAFSSNSPTYTTPGTYTWTAPGDITSLTSAECWGAGGGGGTQFDLEGGGGGGGGEYAKETSVAVTPGSSYTVIVGAGGAQTADGGDSSFAADSVTVTAHGGKGTGSRAGAAGGTGSTNTTHHDGGAGADSSGTGGTGGAGGGSSAGTSAAGNAGSTNSSTTGGSGGSAPTGGGAGGDGGTYTSSCVSLDTEILTKRGWLTCEQVKPGDWTWAIDLERGEPGWSRVLDVRVFEHRCQMTDVTGPGISARASAQHRWLVRTESGCWAYKTIASLEPGDFIPFEDRTGVWAHDLKVSTGEGDDRIWCPTVEHGNWLARRNETTYFTGNKP